MRWRRSEGDEAPDQVPARDDRARPDVPVDLGVVDEEELGRAARRVVARALTEDLAGEQDLTSSLTVPVGTTGRAVLVAREGGVVAGLDLLREVCSQVDHRLRVHLKLFDGDRVQTGDVVAEVTGPLRTLLTAERTALNLVCHLSGVATRTREFADLLEGTDCVVRDTRKTTPGLRLLEKHAVAVGGGANHRIGLYDAVLVKDNHVAAAGSVTAAARAALAGAPDGVHVQVEVTSMAEAEEALAVGVTDLLLDNFSPDELREAVAAIAGRAAVEASGGITLETARAFAEAGADRLAVGALTHSAPSLDLALDVLAVDVPERQADLLRTTPQPVEEPDHGAHDEQAPAAEVVADDGERTADASVDTSPDEPGGDEPDDAVAEPDDAPADDAAADAGPRPVSWLEVPDEDEFDSADASGDD